MFSKIESFSLKSQKFKYCIESCSNNYFLDDVKKQMALFENGKILVYNIKASNEIHRIECNKYLCIKSIFDYTNSLIYLLNLENIYIYDLKKKKKMPSEPSFAYYLLFLSVLHSSCCIR